MIGSVNYVGMNVKCYTCALGVSCINYESIKNTFMVELREYGFTY